MTKDISDALYSEQNDGNITDALFSIAHALHKIANNLDLFRSDHPLMGSTLDEVYTGLSEIADAIKTNGSHE